MTTNSKIGPYGLKYATFLHLIYRITDDRQLEVLGVLETREAAERELAVINRDGTWSIAAINCLDWGIVNGVALETRRRRDGRAPSLA